MMRVGQGATSISLPFVSLSGMLIKKLRMALKKPFRYGGEIYGIALSLLTMKTVLVSH